MARATNRPLYPYLGKSEVFHCPADKGQEEGPLDFLNSDGHWKPSNYESLGCSYRLNAGLWSDTVLPAADAGANLAAKKESWVPDPSRFILMHEPSAYSYANYYHWHYARGPTTVTWNQLPDDGQKFISPILFVDGHAASHDFTHVLKGLDIEEAVVSLGVAVLLLRSRALFDAPTPRHRWRTAIVMVVTIIPVSFVYGVVGFAVRHDRVRPEFTFGGAVQETAARLVGLTGPLAVTGGFGRWFPASITVLGFVALIAIAVAVLAPVTEGTVAPVTRLDEVRPRRAGRGASSSRLPGPTGC